MNEGEKIVEYSPQASNKEIFIMARIHKNKITNYIQVVCGSCSTKKKSCKSQIYMHDEHITVHGTGNIDIFDIRRITELICSDEKKEMRKFFLYVCIEKS